MRRSHYLLTAALVALLGGPAAAFAAGDEATRFDGRWDVTLDCPPHHEDDDAKGYVHRFPVDVRGGMLDGTHGTEGQPSWHHLFGTIAPDGTAALTLDGIVNNPAYAINNAQRGKPYTYRVRAAFEQTEGHGRRIGKRRCSFAFRRR